MRRTKTGWSQTDFKSLYEHYGFVAKEGGNHTTYIHQQHGIIAQVPRHRKLKECYAETAVENIDMHLALLAAAEVQNQEAEPNANQP